MIKKLPQKNRIALPSPLKPKFPIVGMGASAGGLEAFELFFKAMPITSGMVMVQDEKSAKYTGMPRSAIAKGLVDYVMPAEKMPDKERQKDTGLINGNCPEG